MLGVGIGHDPMRCHDRRTPHRGQRSAVSTTEFEDLCRRLRGAVANVGTAALAALIGAGGHDQPIPTGIRLDKLRLVLEGAVPAALRALRVQGLFELGERQLLPRGLRRAPP